MPAGCVLVEQAMRVFRRIFWKFCKMHSNFTQICHVYHRYFAQLLSLERGGSVYLYLEDFENAEKCATLKVHLWKMRSVHARSPRGRTWTATASAARGSTRCRHERASSQLLRPLAYGDSTPKVQNACWSRKMFCFRSYFSNNAGKFCKLLHNYLIIYRSLIVF